MGKLAPRTENPVPEIAAEVMVNGALPLELTVTDFVTAVPTAILPKGIEVELRVTAGVAAFSCNERVLDVVPELAVSETD